jgi:cell division protein FtsB
MASSAFSVLEYYIQRQLHVMLIASWACLTLSMGQEKRMKKQTMGIFGRVLVASGFLLVTGSVYATEQAQQRREARDTKQETRQEARETKADCRAEDQKNNAECRQEKRETKQEGREKARDIKY